jgi:hypothetical protein
VDLDLCGDALVEHGADEFKDGGEYPRRADDEDLGLDLQHKNKKTGRGGGGENKKE